MTRKLIGHPVVIGAYCLWLSGAEYLAANEEIALAWQGIGSLSNIVTLIVRDTDTQAQQRDHTSPLLAL